MYRFYSVNFLSAQLEFESLWKILRENVQKTKLFSKRFTLVSGYYVPTGMHAAEDDKGDKIIY